MIRRMMLLGSLMAGVAPAAFPQAGNQAASQTEAARCQLDGTTFQSRKFSELRAAGQALTSDVTAPLFAEGKRSARDCASKIALDGASPAELAALTSLYLFTNDTAKAKAAGALAQAKPGMSELERANAIVAGVQLSIATFDPFAGINPEAERLVRDIDQLSDAVLAQKIRAHQQLLGRYEYADIDDGLRDHAHKQ